MKHSIERVVTVVVAMGLLVAAGCIFLGFIPKSPSTPKELDANLPFLAVTEGPVHIGWANFRMLSNRVTGEEYLFLTRSGGAIFLVPVRSRGGLTNGK